MIHLLGWVAVVLQAAYSYQRRPFPPGKDHRAELPALSYSMVLFLILMLLVAVTGTGGQAEPAVLDRSVLWVPVA